MLKKPSFRRGFTVLEMVLVVGLSGLLLTALVRFLVFGYPVSKITLLQIRSTETARLQLKRLAGSLRELRTADTGAYPIAEATPARLIFYANVDGDAATERVRYELTGINLVRGITKPSGNPLSYNLAQESVTTVASNIRNGSSAVFTYYDGNYPTNETPVNPTNVTAIKYVQFSLTIDADPAGNSNPIQITSQVQLRNLKTNLADPGN